MKRLLVVGIVVAGAVLARGGDVAADPPIAPTFRGSSPARLADTRASGTTVDGLVRGDGALGANGTLSVPVLGRGGVPGSGVGAVALNVTAINPTAASFITVYPAGAVRPNASNLNLAPGRTLPNMVIVPVGAGGAVTVYNDRGTTHVAVDVLGWFPTGPSFTGLTPARLADSRSSGSTVDGSGKGTGPLGAQSTASVVVSGRGGVPAAGVGAVALNVTAINPSAASFVTVFPAGAVRPNASNLNLAPGRTLPNMVIVPVGEAGAITVYNDQGTTNFAVDVLGWFPDGPTFSGLTPARLGDTRASGVTVDGESQRTGALERGASWTVTMTGRGGVPAVGVGAVALNVTAINPTAASFVTVHPAGAARPNTSNLNLAPGRTLPNMVIVPVGAGGAVTIYNDQGSAHVAVDVLGWFPATTNPAATTRVSVDSAGVQGANSSFFASVSADGRYVAFDSFANNLVPGDTNGFRDVFVRDRALGVTTRVSVRNNGTEGNGPSYRASISGDGRYVAFESMATNLVPGDTNDADDVFVHDRITATTVRVSLRTNGVQGNGPSIQAAISADGRHVAFQSSATNLVDGDSNGVDDVFLHNTLTGVTSRVSVRSDGSEANAFSTSASVSGDGRLVLFDSVATNLVDGDTNAAYDVFLHDTTSSTTVRVSVASGGAQASGLSFRGTISTDGRFVAFQSSAENLVPGGSPGVYGVFVRDILLGLTTRVSVTSAGQPGNADSDSPSISADGRYVAFGSDATNLVNGDSNGVKDVFVHDRAVGKTSRVSISTNGVQGNGSSGSASISADGRYIGFGSSATTLVAGDSNGVSDVFVHDQGTI